MRRGPAAVAVLAAAMVLTGPVPQAHAAGCDENELYAFVTGSSGDFDSGDILALSTRAKTLSGTGKPVDNRQTGGGANAINPLTGVHWFTVKGNQTYSTHPHGTPYHWRDLSGPSVKDGFGFRKDGYGYFLAETGGRVDVYSFWHERPAGRQRISLSGMDENPVDLAFDGRDRAWLVTADGSLWRVDDVRSSSWRARLAYAADNSGERVEGIALGRLDGKETIFVSGSYSSGERFVSRAEPDGKEVWYDPLPALSGSGSITDLASCSYPSLGSY
ncbi:hypothetical protein ACFPM3_07040 [Streptomyces coeruleoprunus]|uniref:Uncharacterized protein n=1 Tax=Streptomyces coeruleoprunus TaxID=285563 RepID=A0ABV9XC86_9ACTN